MEVSPVLARQAYFGEIISRVKYLRNKAVNIGNLSELTCKKLLPKDDLSKDEVRADKQKKSQEDDMDFITIMHLYLSELEINLNIIERDIRDIYNELPTNTKQDYL